jgi:hypothetical protein
MWRNLLPPPSRYKLILPWLCRPYVLPKCDIHGSKPCCLRFNSVRLWCRVMVCVILDNPNDRSVLICRVSRPKQWLLDPEDGGAMLVWNVGNQTSTVGHPRAPEPSQKCWYVYQGTQRHKPEEKSINHHHQQNLKSYVSKCLNWKTLDFSPGVYSWFTDWSFQ